MTTTIIPSRIRLGFPSPWGAIDHKTEYHNPKHPNEIVTFVSTPSHGGFYVPANLLTLFPVAVLQSTWGKLGCAGWFEEDSDATLVPCFLRNWFPADEYASACQCLIGAARFGNGAALAALAARPDFQI